ncbi:MAG: GrpB family protein, partial [Acidimicrobiia bacterium]
MIVPYDTRWPEMFEAQRVRVEDALGPRLVRPVEHMGSTAVPGLPAKSIIDMLAVVTDIDAKPDAVDAMKMRGWVSAPEPGDDAQHRASFCFPSVEHRTHHLHVVENRFAEWPRWLAFRDYLIDHPEVATSYADLKRQLADLHGHDPNDREAYRQG